MPNIITTQTALALAKIYYEPQILKYWKFVGGKKALFDREAPDRVRELSARGGVVAISVNPNMQGGFFGEGGVLPPEGASTYENLTFTYTRYAQGVRLTGDALRTLRREGPTSFANILSRELQNAVESLNILFNRMLNFDNQAYLAIVSANSPAGGSTTVNTASGDRAFYLTRDMVVSFVDPATGNYRTPRNVRIVGVASDLTSITVDQPVTVSAGDLIVQRESYGLGLYGLSYHISSPMWLGLNRATTYANLLGIRINAGGSDISAATLQQAASMIEQMHGNPQDYVLIWSPAQEVKYKAGGYALKRFVNTETVNLMFTEVEVGPFRALVDADNPVDTVFIVNPREFFWVNLQELTWGTEDGSNLHILPFVQGTGQVAPYRDEYWSPLIWRGQLICEYPFRQALISNLSFDTIFRSRSNTSFIS
jgi:hypothetical protein